MAELDTILKSLEGMPGRTRTVLKQVVLVLDDVIDNPNDQQYRQLSRDELPATGVTLLRSCGFVENGPSQLCLPEGAPISMVEQAREKVKQLLRPPAASAQKENLPKVDFCGNLPKVPAPIIKAGEAAAAALKASAVAASPTRHPREDQWSGRDDELVAAKSTCTKRRGLDDDKPKEVTKTVPAAVQATAAAVSQGIAQRNPQLYQQITSAGTERRLTASGRVANPSAAGGRATGGGGKSTWTAAPPGVTAESRLFVDLPESEFTYIERPWQHFVTRWAAIDTELEHAYTDSAFSMIDLGSCNGFFSLQAASGYRNSTVLGIEGSVGIGNGTTGVEGNENEILSTKAVQTYLRWIDKLSLQNCFLCPEVWDYRRVCALSALGRPIADVLLSLSVIHHIDNISQQQYEDDGMSHVTGTLQLVAKLLLLATRHFIELPDRPWIEHVHNAYSSHQAFLEAAATASGKRWTFVGPLCVSSWYGTRELWMLEEENASRRGTAMPPQGLRAFFPRIFPQAQAQATTTQNSIAHRAPAQPVRRQPGQQIPTRDSVGQLATSRTSLPGSGAMNRRDPASHMMAPLVGEDLGSALLAAPTALIAAHVQLRDASNVAEALLRDGQATAPAS